MRISGLKGRWLTFWNEGNAEGAALNYYNLLQESYSRPGRYFHNLDHIDHCLDEYDKARHLLEHPQEVEMAIWFHDIVYEIGSDDNEERSAELAFKISKEILFPDSFGIAVHDLIVVTLHTFMPNTNDAFFMADIDLSFLGKPQEEYDKDEIRIRKEYGHVPEDQFKKGRTAILRRFLDRPSIYYTRFFRDKYEEKARKNLERSIIKLTKINQS